MLSNIGRRLCDADQIVVNHYQMDLAEEIRAVLGCRKSLQFTDTGPEDYL